MPPIALGNSMSKMAVIISGDALSTVVKIKRTLKKGKFMAEPVQGDGGAGSSKPKRFEVDKEDVCRVEHHDSQYDL